MQQEVRVPNGDAEPTNEQQSLLPSCESVSLNEQIIYESTGSLISNASELDPTTNDDTLEIKDMSIIQLVSILSTAFSYGCILTTLFLITLPVECERIQDQHPSIPKSVSLGNFVAIAGVTQLISPFVGRLSDTFEPPPPRDIGQRLPYLVVGAVLTVFGLLGQMFASYRSFWLRYSFAFFAHMIGLNMMYAMMLAMIPDQVPGRQTGIANGILAGLLVTGSLFGFGLFHGFLRNNIQSMYALYTCIVVASSILTGIYGHDGDVAMTLHRNRQRKYCERRVSERATDTNMNQKHHTKRQRMIRRIKKATRHVTKKVVVTPTIILRSMLFDTIKDMSCEALYQSYTIDMEKNRDFFWVTVSRLFYYCGMSVQTFFMYFLQDIIQLKSDPEGAVARLSIIGQLAGAFTCVPVGIASDLYFSGKRKPFVYFACVVLASTTFSAIFARDMNHMVIIMSILGGANGVYLTMDTSLAVDTLPKDLESTAQLLGIWGVAAFLGSALGPMVGGPILYYVGSQYDYTDDGEAERLDGYSLKGYSVILSLSSIYFLLSSLSLWFVRH